MSEWTQYHPKLRLYEVIDKPGGITVESALLRGNAAVEEHRAGACATLGEKIAKLEALVRTRGDEAAEVHALATFVLDIAGIYKPDLFRAAHSLCDLVERMEAAGRWDWPPIEVHVAAMRALMDAEHEDAAMVKSVLSGLGAVVGRYPDPHPPEPKREKPPAA